VLDAITHALIEKRFITAEDAMIRGEETS